MNGWRANASALTALWLLASAVLGGCAGGSSSETVGLWPHGMVIATTGGDEITGRTDPGNIVGLYGADFKPHLDSGYARTATADSSGGFAFTGLRPGNYRLLVRHPSDGTAALLAELAVRDARDTARGRLEPTGSLSGTIADSTTVIMGIVYVPGTPFYAAADSLSRYALPRLPPGSYPVVKSWKRPYGGCPGAPCAALESRQDSTVMRIESGQSAVW